MKPYYDEGGITIFHGDCREIAPLLTFDFVLTDPPYGIGFVHGALNIPNATKFSGVPVIGDDKPFDPSFWLKWPCLLWGANHYANRLPGGGRWLVWDKRGNSDCHGKDQSDIEMAWVSGPRRADRIYKQLWDGFLREGERGIPRVHPTQKPVNLMKWCFTFLLEGTILDPFMGSGTTLRAAKDLGRKAIGIEIELKYVEIAIRRLQQQVLPLEVQPIEKRERDVEPSMFTGMTPITDGE